MKKIILCTDGSAYSEANYQYGAWLTRQLSTPLEVLYVSPERRKASQSKNLSGSIGFNASDTLLKRMVQLEHDFAKLEQEKAAEILHHAEETFKGLGLTQNTYVHHEGDLAQDLLTLESQADLILLEWGGGTDEMSREKHLGTRTERIMRSLDTPCWLSTQTFHPIEQVMLAYDGSQPSQTAFRKLIQLPFMARCMLHLVQVAPREDPEALVHLSQLQAQAHTLGIQTRIALLTGSIEESLQSYIAQNLMNLLVMGIHGHRPLHSFIMGHTTTHMIQETAIPVLIYR